MIRRWITFIIMLFASFSSSKADTILETLLNTSAQPNWKITEETDKLTDETTRKAIKTYSLQDNGTIVAIFECKKIPFLTAQIDALELEFDYFSLGDNGNGENQDSAFEHESKVHELWGYGRQAWQDSREPKEVITIEYRFDNEPIEQAEVQPKYRNQVIIHFTEMLGNDVQRMSASNLLRVRLPLSGGRRADIEIKLNDLKDFFKKCPLIANIKSRDSNRDDTIRQHDTAANVPNMFGGGPYKPVEDLTLKMMREAGVKVGSSNHPNSPPSGQTAPSIKCNSSRLTTVELIVCSSPNLMKTDVELHRTYQQLLQSLDKASAISLKKSQKQWLAKRSSECRVQLGDIDEQESSRLLMCLQGLYDRRVSELQSGLE